MQKRVRKAVSHVSALHAGRYLQRFRLQKAAERLCKTETPVAQIALDCGFSGASYFTGCFKKIYGCTPKAYRSSRKNTKA